MNRRQMKKKVKGHYKSFKAGIIADEKEYWNRVNATMKCEDATCKRRSNCTLSIVRADDNKIVLEFRLCLQHASVYRKKYGFGLKVIITYDRGDDDNGSSS